MPYVIFHYMIICYVFLEATSTFLENFTNSTKNHLCWSLFFHMIIKLYKDISSTWISHTFVENFSSYIDVAKSKKSEKSIVILLRALLWILGKWFMKTSIKKHLFHNKHFYIYGHRQFEVLWSFILYIL